MSISSLIPGSWTDPRTSQMLDIYWNRSHWSFDLSSLLELRFSQISLRMLELVDFQLVTEMLYVFIVRHLIIVSILFSSGRHCFIVTMSIIFYFHINIFCSVRKIFKYYRMISISMHSNENNISSMSCQGVISINFLLPE